MHPKDAVIQFGKHSGKSFGYLLKNEYHYCKWLLNQPESKNKNFEKARTCLNMLLEDDAFVSELADYIPDTTPNHKYGEVQTKFYESEGKDYTTGPTPKHVHPSEGDGIDFLLVSRIADDHQFDFEYAKDIVLMNNFQEKYTVDGIDTLLILQRSEGELTLVNYKFVEDIVEEKGECDFLWQS